MLWREETYNGNARNFMEVLVYAGIVDCGFLYRLLMFSNVARVTRQQIIPLLHHKHSRNVENHSSLLI